MPQAWQRLQADGKPVLLQGTAEQWALPEPGDLYGAWKLAWPRPVVAPPGLVWGERAAWAVKALAASARLARGPQAWLQPVWREPVQQEAAPSPRVPMEQPGALEGAPAGLLASSEPLSLRLP